MLHILFCDSHRAVPLPDISIAAFSAFLHHANGLAVLLGACLDTAKTAAKAISGIQCLESWMHNATN